MDRSSPRILAYGPRALLAEFASLDDVMSAAAHLRRVASAGVVEIVPAARTVLVVHDGSATSAIIHELGNGFDDDAVDGPTVTIEVDYDGPDLGDVAQATGLDVDEVIAAHTAPLYRVAFCGFLPGFAYLIGLDERLRLPRRSTPRPRVEAGSVAIASEHTSVYPQASPGGWHLLGRTSATMWDDSREPPALLAPGTTVRFVAR